MQLEIAEFEAIVAHCELCGVARDWANKDEACLHVWPPQPQHAWHEETEDEEQERLFHEACERD